MTPSGAGGTGGRRVASHNVDTASATAAPARTLLRVSQPRDVSREGVITAAGTVAVVCVNRNDGSSSASRNALAVSNRSAGNFSTAFATAPATCGGTVG